MRNGKNILRMQADEEDVYHLMDLRERYFVLIGAGSLIAVSYTHLTLPTNWTV